MKYENPVLLSDYSDPDVIRVGDDYYMVASSFNHVPGVPVLHSKNLVEWELINHVIGELPFEKFNKVCHGHGAWAPSIRYHNGKFYCLIPFPDEGIFVAETTDPYGKWSLLRPLLTGAGYEDPCPIWADGKCYVVFAFVKSRIGFNSRLAVFEADEDLKERTTDYKVIYDGRDISPKIEGPKFYKHGDYYYILAPAGGVKTGWQVALRSKTIYGNWETKIIMVQGDSPVNGPHQGALIDLDDNGEKWAFMHFQDMGPYGRVVHLQPAVWDNDWVICGVWQHDGMAGAPVEGGDYPVDFETGAKIDPSDEFEGDKLSLIWQTPANRKAEWFTFKRGLKLNCCYFEKPALSDLPQLVMQKVQYKNFAVNCKCKLNLVNDGDEVGFTVFGRSYAYVCVVRRGGQNFLEIRKGTIGGEEDETLAKSQPYDEGSVTFKISAKYEAPNRLSYKFSFGGSAFTHKFYAERGVWTGAKIGIYARGEEGSKGSATFKYFRVTCTDNRIK
ncbi:MAG: glycoside hydrolase 43 family protein [Clostridia bacterium]|nr:glycoside hydrolase 43 family protein [Clostridia bacterium]